MNRRWFVRNLAAATLLEQFLVSAVIAIIGIRSYLELTGYPRVGGGDLHIAHMLWGGLLMLIAMVLLLTTIGDETRTWGAIIGGLGFGTFIDEVGKFITSDNNYFYQPSVAIIYVLFIGIFLVYRSLASSTTASATTYLANSFEIVRDLSTGLPSPRASKLGDYLDRAETAPGAVGVHLIATQLVVPLPRETPLTRLVAAMRLRAIRVTRSRLFGRILILVFTVISLERFAQAIDSRSVAIFIVPIALALALIASLAPAAGRFGVHVAVPSAAAVILGVWFAARWGGAAFAGYTFGEWGALLATFCSFALVMAGAASLWRSRVRALHYFRYGTLISIFFGQVFAFYEIQLLALGGLAVDVVILGGLRGLLEVEKERLPATPSGDR